MTEIKSYEDVCQKLGINPDQLPGVDNLPEHQRKAVIAHAKLLNIAEAYNDGWKPDWSNYDEYKWTPWFDMNTELMGNNCNSLFEHQQAVYSNGKRTRVLRYYFEEGGRF